MRISLIAQLFQVILLACMQSSCRFLTLSQRHHKVNGLPTIYNIYETLRRRLQEPCEILRAWSRFAAVTVFGDCNCVLKIFAHVEYEASYLIVFQNSCLLNFRFVLYRSLPLLPYSCFRKTR